VYAKTYLLKQVAGAYSLLDSVLEGLTIDLLHWIPPGTANPVGGRCTGADV